MLGTAGVQLYKLPDWIANSQRRPREYQHLYEEVKRADGSTCSEKVSNLLITSGLRREYLSYIWASANRVTPGVLTQEEFFVVLALVALAQKGAPNLNVTMLDKITEPPIPVFSRPGPMYNGATNLSSQVHHQINGVNHANPNLHSNDRNFISQKIFPSLSHLSQESTDDEFSDFQSATTLPTGNQVKTPGSSFGSPLHLSSTIHSIEPSGRNQPNSSSEIAGGNKASIVGCRLANYDLGFPTASPRMSQQQPRNVPVVQPLTPPLHANLNGPPRSGDNLLIGEEDKYSALRGLTDFSTPDTSIFDATETQNRTSNVQHKISLVSDDVLEVIKTETTDTSLDFGDFQSFSSEHECTFPPKISTNGFKNEFNIPLTANSTAFINVKSAFDSKTGNNSKENVSHVNALQGLDILSPVNPTQQAASSFNDGEFGDFVSFSAPVGLFEPKAAPATSPTIILKSEVSKKFTSSSTKSKKPHNVGKINVSRIAKASNILTESPTFPKPDVSEVTINDRSLFYEDSSVLKEPTSFAIDTEGFNIDLSKPPNENSACDPINRFDTLEFGAPLKTTLIGSSAEIDDFGDFAGVQQVPTLESSSKINTLDILSYSSKCPAETQSLKSLDLGNYLESSDGNFCGENDASPDLSENIGFDSYLKHDVEDTANVILSTSLTEKCFTLNVSDAEVHTESAKSDDKYKCFKEEIENERDRCSAEWSRCLESCLNLLSHAHSIFNSVSSSEVIREIVSNEKGSSYVTNLIEVYLVACRINISWKKMGGNMKVQKLSEDINVTWESLTPLFLGTPAMESVNKVNDRLRIDFSHLDNVKVCGVCLVNSIDEDQNTLLDYGGKYYHSTCANLWINEVDSILPSLYCFSNT